MNTTSPTPTARRALSMAEIASLIAHSHGLTAAELRSRTRCWRIVRPRQEAMALMRAQTRPSGRPRFSCLQIARYFGLLNHSSCVRALKVIRARQSIRQSAEKFARLAASTPR